MIETGYLRETISGMAISFMMWVVYVFAIFPIQDRYISHFAWKILSGILFFTAIVYVNMNMGTWLSVCLVSIMITFEVFSAFDVSSD